MSAREPSPLDDLPPEILNELLADDDDDHHYTLDDDLSNLLESVAAAPDRGLLSGTAALLSDVYAQANFDDDEEADMPADFDVNAQSWLEYK